MLILGINISYISFFLFKFQFFPKISGGGEDASFDPTHVCTAGCEQTTGSLTGRLLSTFCTIALSYIKITKY